MKFMMFLIIQIKENGKILLYIFINKNKFKETF